MGYTLNATSIKSPKNMRVDNSTQYAENRTLGGSVGRDYFGSNKQIWVLDYENLNSTDFATIQTLYQLYLSNHSPLAFVISEGVYTATASVHVDLLTRSFGIPGSSYLSTTTLTLKEA